MEIRCNCHSGCGYGDNGDNSRILPTLPVAEPVDQLSTAPHSGAGCIIAPCAYPRTGSHLPTGNPRSRQSFPQHCPHAFPQSTSLIHRISQVIHIRLHPVPVRHALCQAGTGSLRDPHAHARGSISSVTSEGKRTARALLVQVDRARYALHDNRRRDVFLISTVLRACDAVMLERKSSDGNHGRQVDDRQHRE